MGERVLFSAGGWRLLGVAIVVLAVHGGRSTGGFHYDDVHSIVDNPALVSLRHIPEFFVDASAFSVDADKGMYRPVLLTTYALDHALQGPLANGFLRTNLLLHALNALLVAWVALALTRQLLVAATAGALFGLHPAATEPIYYVSARSDSLVALFVLATVVLWLHGTSWRTRTGGWLTAVAALWTKATAIMLPPLLLSLDAIASPRPQGRTLVRRHWPWLVVVPVYLACLWWTRFLPKSLAAPVREPLLHGLTQIKAVAFYLRLFVFPVHGSVHPAFSVSDGATPVVAASVLLAASLSAVAVALWRCGCRRHVVLGVWIIAAMLPTALVPLNVLVNERRAYLPLAAVAIGLAWCLGRLRFAPMWRHAAAAATLVLFITISLARAEVWASDLALWQDAAGKAPQMPRAQLYLGDAHLAVARETPASSHLHLQSARVAYGATVSLAGAQQLLRLQALNGLAIIDLEAGNLEAAEARLQQVLSEHPDYVDALVNLGGVHYARARDSRGADRVALQQATELFERAVQLAPGRYEARLNLGACYHLSGDLARAQTEYETVVAQAPASDMAALNLGLLYLQRASLEPRQSAWRQRAIAELERAIRLQPVNDAARRALAAAREAAR